MGNAVRSLAFGPDALLTVANRLVALRCRAPPSWSPPATPVRLVSPFGGSAQPEQDTADYSIPDPFLARRELTAQHVHVTPRVRVCGMHSNGDPAVIVFNLTRVIAVLVHRTGWTRSSTATLITPPAVPSDDWLRNSVSRIAQKSPAGPEIAGPAAVERLRSEHH